MRNKVQAQADIKVIAPTKGLVTRMPSNLPDKEGLRAIVACSNVRAMDGTLQAAPGYQRISSEPVLDSVPNLIFQGSISVNDGTSSLIVPVVATENKLWSIKRGEGYPPTVYAGPDATIDVGNGYTMQASADDVDGTPLTYTWRLLDYPPAKTAYFKTDVLNPSLTVTGEGTYTFQLTVTDGTYIVSDSVTLEFTDTDPTAYVPQIPVTAPFTQPACGSNVVVQVDAGFYPYSTVGETVRYLGSAYSIVSRDGTTQLTLKRECGDDPDGGAYAIPPGGTVPSGGGSGYPDAPGNGGPANPGPGNVGNDLGSYKDLVDTLGGYNGTMSWTSVTATMAGDFSTTSGNTLIIAGSTGITAGTSGTSGYLQMNKFVGLFVSFPNIPMGNVSGSGTTGVYTFGAGNGAATNAQICINGAAPVQYPVTNGPCNDFPSGAEELAVVVTGGPIDDTSFKLRAAYTINPDHPNTKIRSFAVSGSLQVTFT